MKYINRFSTNADYQAFTEGGDYVTPNVCYVEETNGIIVKPEEFIETIILTFTIEDMFNMYPSKTYNFEEGMTFEEFCNSSYNVDNWEVINYNSRDYIKHHNDSHVYENGKPVMPYDIIKSDGKYFYEL